MAAKDREPVQLWSNMGWNINKKLGRYTNCKYCIEVDLILMYNQKGSRLGRVWYIIYTTNMKRTLLHTSHDEEVSWLLTLRQEIQNIHISNWVY
jgi:hypothetical protein